MTDWSGQPIVRANDWSELEVPGLGAWEPTLSVSVVVPAYDPVHLPKVLAALAAQTYPERLLEVVVVDDGSSPPVELPELRPEHTRLVRTDPAHGWGRAAACQTGAEASGGEVIHWLDADMVPCGHEVEAQLRWHHQIDYAVVLGEKVFGNEDALDHLDAETIRAAIAAGDSPDRLARGEVVPHEWIEAIRKDTADLTTAGPRAMRAHAGASASVGRDLFNASGGMPVDLVLGEDIVLGYRLREAGAVFIPDRQALSLHLGPSTMMRGADEVNRYNKPFITDKVPEFRGHRLAFPRSYEVPYVEVVIPVADASYETVRAAVDHQLSCSVPDVIVTLVAPWSELTDARRPPVAGPLPDLRLVRAAYASEPRVRLVESPAALSEATFRLDLPDPDHFPVGKALAKLLYGMEDDHLGMVSVALLDTPAVLTRAAVTARACRARQGGASYNAALRRIYPSRSTDVDAAGFVSAEAAPSIKQTRGLVTWGSAG